MPDDIDAVLITTPSTDWVAELAKLPSRMDRQHRRSELMNRLERSLRQQLKGLAVDLERMEAVGGWTARGEKSVVARLRDSGGPLRGSEFVVVPDATFHTL